jgi:hypothetical protein
MHVRLDLLGKILIDKSNLIHVLTQTGLLAAGYIPSKLTYRAMLEGLELRSDISRRRTNPNNKLLSQQPDDTFQFLLFVLDSIESRKLTVDSAFYSAILVLGAQNGGLLKRVAYLISDSRRKHKEMTIADGEETSTGAHLVKWEELFMNYSMYKAELNSKIELPLVRVSTQEFGRVLAAEQAVSYQAVRKR